MPDTMRRAEDVCRRGREHYRVSIIGFHLAGVPVGSEDPVEWDFRRRLVARGGATPPMQRSVGSFGWSGFAGTSYQDGIRIAAGSYTRTT